MTVSRTELARALGKTVRQLETLLQRGMPVVTMADRAAGIQYEFDEADCREWLEDYEDQLHSEAEIKRQIQEIATEENEDIVKARIAKLEVETKRLQLRLEKEQGELVPIDAIAAVVDRQFASVKAHLLALPAKLSPMLINISDRKEIDEVMTSYIHEALEELSNDAVYVLEAEIEELDESTEST